MPFVRIAVTQEGVTREQKLLLIQGVTQLLQDVLQKDPLYTHVVIEEIALDNWGVSGQSVAQLRAQTSNHQ